MPCRESQIWSAMVLFAAWISFPFVLSFCLLASAWHRLTHGRAPPPKSTGPQRTAIVTGGKSAPLVPPRRVTRRPFSSLVCFSSPPCAVTKALCVCRHLKAQGCRVVLVETHKYWMVATRFSNSVDRFITVPVPEQDPIAYKQAIKSLAYEEDADLFVPVCSPVASWYDAGIANVLPPGCRTLSLGQSETAALDDKVVFAELAKSCGLPVPDARKLHSKTEIRAFNEELHAKGSAAKPYVLKNLSYDSMRRLDLFKLPCEPAALDAYIADIEVTASAPWGAQAFVKGQEYSTCAIAYKGVLSCYTDNKASISCFNYEYQASTKLREWVETFVRAHKLTGTLCIDFFIEEGTGKPLAIECNPRFSSNITNFHNSPTFGKAMTNPEELARAGHCEVPLPTAGETNWVAVDAYYALRKPGLSLAQRAYELYSAFFEKKDAYFEPDNVLPFLALHYLHMPTLLMRNIYRGNRWAKIDMCIGKLTEENGD